MNFFSKKVVIGLVAGIIALSMITACAGPAGPAGPAGRAGPAGPAGSTGPAGPPGEPVRQPEATIVLLPNVVEVSVEGKAITTEFTIIGSGFVPDEVVMISIPKASEAELKQTGGTLDDWATAKASQAGTFSATITGKLLIEKFKVSAGIHTVRADGIEGSAASAPLTVTKKE